MLPLKAVCRARVGRTLGLTLYVQLGTDPADSDVLLALFNTRSLAVTARNAVNGLAVDSPRWQAVGRLIYLAGVVASADDFLGVGMDAQAAARIVAAVNGE